MNRSPAKKIAFGFCIVSLIGMAISLVMFLYTLIQRGFNDVLSASLFATTVFFLSCAIVLFFMSKPPRYEMRPWDEGEAGLDGHE